MITDEPKENTTDHVCVVTVAIVNVQARRIMLAQRAPTTLHAWTWGTPGGQAIFVESHQGTIEREMREELGVQIINRIRQEVYAYNLPSSRIAKVVRVHCYLLHLEDAPSAMQAKCLDQTIGIGWFAANDLETLMLTPADDANRGKLMDLIQ